MHSLSRFPHWLACSLLLVISYGSVCRGNAAPPAKQTASTESQTLNPPRLRELDFAPFEQELAALPETQRVKIDALVKGQTIPGIQKALAAGEVTSLELTVYFLARIQRLDSTLRSYTEVNPQCIEEAKAADRARAEGKSPGGLHGIPLNLKDNIGTPAPLHTTAGAEILLHHSPQHDAAVVARLRAAGAIILGKASLSELAGALTTEPPGYNAVSGIGINPHGSDWPVSGSSSGSAISTSAGLTLVSVGTETSGSLISPASMNGVVAMKPSLGVVSGEGIVPLIRFQDSAGPVARSVTDAAVLLTAIGTRGVDYTATLQPRALEGVSVGVLRKGIQGKGSADRNEEWLKLIDRGLSAAKATSHDVAETFASKPELTPIIFLGLAEDTVGYLKAVSAPVGGLTDLQAYNLAQPERRIPRGQNMLDLGVQILAAIGKETAGKDVDLGKLYEGASLAARNDAAALLAGTFDEHKVSVLVSLGNTHSDLYATAGYPAITVPLGLSKDGAPNGVTFIGRRAEDAKLLAYAYAFEQATRYHRHPAACWP